MKSSWTHFFRRMASLSAMGTSVMAASAANFAWALASDNAGNAPYADGWQDGDNGGFGYQPWASGFSGDAGALVHAGPKFIDNGPLAGNSLGNPAFALSTSDRAYFFDTSEVTRLFSSPLQVGQTFRADVDGPELLPNGFGFDYGIGATFQLCSNGTCGGSGSPNERFGLFVNFGSNPNWTNTPGVDTGIPSANGFHIEMKLVTADTFDVVLSPVGGGAPLFSQTAAALGGPAGSAIDNLRVTVYGTGSSADGSTELFFNNVSIVPEPGTGILLVLGAGGAVLGSLRRRRE